MSGKLIPDSTLDQVKRLRNDCTKISEERHQQKLKYKESSLQLATMRFKYVFPTGVSI